MITTLLAAALAMPAQSCAFHDERGVLIAGGQPTPQFEATGKPWFADGGKIDYAGGTYVKYGAPRQLMPAEIEPAADKDGIPLFIEAGNYVDEPEILYVMASSAECSFQPYGRE